MGFRESCCIDNSAVRDVSGSSDLIWDVYVSIFKMKMVKINIFDMSSHIERIFGVVIYFQLFIIG